MLEANLVKVFQLDTPLQFCFYCSCVAWKLREFQKCAACLSYHSKHLTAQAK